MPDTPDAGGVKAPTVKTSTMSELLDSLTTTVGRGLPEPYVAREVLAVARKAMKLHNETERDLAKAVEAARAYSDLCVCYRIGKRPTERLFERIDRAKAFLARFGKDTP